MSINYQKEWENYNTLSFDNQREIVLWILETFRGKWETFDLIYDYIVRWEGVTKEDLQDVYRSLMETAYQTDQENEKHALEKLESVKTKAILMREQERQEAEIAQKEASTLMNML
jgi:hypothetical protein